MIPEITVSNLLTQYIPYDCKCKLSGKNYNLNQSRILVNVDTAVKKTIASMYMKKMYV